MWSVVILGLMFQNVNKEDAVVLLTNGHMSVIVIVSDICPFIVPERIGSTTDRRRCHMNQEA